MAINFNPIVDVLFDGTNWDIITRYVKVDDGINIPQRGREDNQDEIQTGSMSLTLLNDGRFTPGLASSPHYPNVIKGKRIRVRVVYWSTNMVTNPTMEAGTTDWAAAGTVVPVLTQSATHVQAGSQAMLVTWGTGGTGPAAQTVVHGLEIGEHYTASAYVWVPAGGSPAVRLGVTGLSTGTASSTTGAFQRVTYSFTATNTTHTLQVSPTTAATSGHQVWVDSVQVEKGAAATTFSATPAQVFTRFDGYVNAWPTEWNGGINGIVETRITASDLLKKLGGLAPMRSLLEEEMLALKPDAYYTLSEDTDATSAGDTSGHGQQSMKVYQVSGAGGTIAFAADDGPGTDDLPAPRFTPFSLGQGKGLRADLRASTGTVVIACWLKTNLAGRDFLQICNRFTGVGGAAFVLNVDSADGTLRGTAYLGEDGNSGDYGGGPGLTQNLADGKNHLVVVQLRDTGSVFANVDGVDGVAGFAFGSVVSDAVDLYDRIVAGGFKDPTGSFSGANLFDGVLSHIWVKRMASMPDWTFAFSAGSGQTESTTDRFLRLYGLLGLTGTVRGSTITQISAQVSGGKDPLQAFRDVAAVEAGLIFASRDGASLVMECRNFRYNLASSVTLDTLNFQEDLRWSDDDQPMINDYTTRRDGGADQRVINQASIDKYETVYADGDSQPWATDDDALAVSQWTVANGADPPPRVTNVTVKVDATDLWASVLGLDISHVITLDDLPPESPLPTARLHVEGYSETITVGSHTITFNTSPAEINDVWQLGVAGHSELGATTRFGL